MMDFVSCHRAAGSYGWLSVAALGALLFGPPSSVLIHAQTTDSYALEVELTGGFALEVDGRSDHEARFYAGHNSPHVVILASSGAGFMLDRGPARIVRKLVDSLVREGSAGTLTLLPGAADVDLPGGYQPDGPGVRFSDGVHSYYLTMKPPLVGEVTVEKILQHSPEYRVTMDRYFPSSDAVSQLRQCSPTARLELFYGSWCAFCRRHVPRLLKALEQAGNPLPIRIVALPRGNFSKEKAAAERDVKRVPTLIAFDGAREIGRLQGKDWEHPEEVLVRMLPAAPAATTSRQ
ncbi:MAG: thioredoxin family protein [Acidobacteriota bacterium]